MKGDVKLADLLRSTPYLVPFWEGSQRVLHRHGPPCPYLGLAAWVVYPNGCAGQAHPGRKALHMAVDGSRLEKNCLMSQRPQDRVGVGVGVGAGHWTGLDYGQEEWRSQGRERGQIDSAERIPIYSTSFTGKSVRPVLEARRTAADCTTGAPSGFGRSEAEAQKRIGVGSPWSDVSFFPC